MFNQTGTDVTSVRSLLFNILRELIDKFKILRNGEENVNFIFSIFSQNGPIWTINAIDLIEHLSVLVLDLVWFEDLFNA